MQRRFALFCTLPFLLSTAAFAQNDVSNAASRYIVDGLALGARVRSDTRAYREYQCGPSESFPGFTWCHKEKTERAGRVEVLHSNSILHTADGIALYVNGYFEPVFFEPNDIEREIDKLSARFGGQPQVLRMPPREGLPDAIIAVWGKIRLEQRDASEVATLASGGTVSGLSVSFLGDLQRSAKAGVPIYRLAGGPGYLWAATFNSAGRGVLRYLTVDESRIEAPATISSNSTQASSPSPEPSRAAAKDHSSSEESSGTGFFVAPHLVLTNNHVIRGCGEYPITVAYPDKRPVKAYVAGQDDTNDLVLLQTDLPNKSIASFRFGPRVGEQVAAYGYPLLGLLSSTGNFTLGNITALAGMRDDTRVLQTSTPVQPGNSGGPLLDMSGSVVGVVEAQLNALAMIRATSDVPQNVNFAIQSPIVINFLSVKGVSPSLARTEHKALGPADVAELAEGFTVQVMCQPAGN